MHALFIGGFVSGQYRDVDNHAAVWRVALPVKLPAFDVDAYMDRVIPIQDYRRGEYVANGTRKPCFVACGMSDAEADVELRKILHPKPEGVAA